MKVLVATICASAALLAGSAMAQPLADPMRPPIAGPVESATKPAEPAVQMIMIAPERRYAVIDGQTVTQGGRVGDARVVRIAETEVTLRGPAGETKVLKLLPQVEKKVVVSPQPARRVAQGEEGRK